MPREHESQTAIALVDPLVGTIFDQRFRIVERIAAGGFGAIYRATHVKSAHQIALKVLLPALAQDLGVVARFRREGATLTALRSPHTITAYELGQAADRTLFIVMELLHGQSLFERYQANGPMEWRRVVKIAREVCESLEEAHTLGIVHRDLKPTNINLETIDGDPDFVKVLDFGIAKIVAGATDIDASDITNAGQMIGTLDYMSPEQMVGGAVSGQTDIYTLGIVMYEVIAGCLPFPEATTAAAALAAMLKTTPQSLFLRAPVPEALDKVVMRCLERETHNRYKSVGELRADLDRLLAEAPAETRTISLDLGTREARRDDGDEATMMTPPPEKVLASLKTPPPERRTPTPAADWSDDDERAETRMPGAQEWEDEDEHQDTVNGPKVAYGRAELEGSSGRAHRADSVDVTVSRPDPRDVKTPRVDARRPDSDVDEGRTTRRPDSNVDVKTPRVDARRSDVDVKAPRVDARRAESNVDVKTPRVDARRSDVDVKSPRVDARRPDSNVDVKTPRLDARRPDSSVDRGTPRADARRPASDVSSSRADPPARAPTISRPPPVPTPRPLEARHRETPVPQLVVAPFSAGARGDQVPSSQHGALPPGQVPSSQYGALPQGQVPSSQYGALPPGQVPSSQYGALPPGQLTPNPQHGLAPPGAAMTTPFGVRTPPHGPFVTPTPPHGPFAIPTPGPFAPNPTPSPFGASPTPPPFGPRPPRPPFGASPTPPPSSMFSTPAPRSPTFPPTGRGQFDMDRMAAREATVRLLVWIIVMVVAAGVAVFVAWMI